MAEEMMGFGDSLPIKVARWFDKHLTTRLLGLVMMVMFVGALILSVYVNLTLGPQVIVKGDRNKIIVAEPADLSSPFQVCDNADFVGYSKGAFATTYTAEWHQQSGGLVTLKYTPEITPDKYSITVNSQTGVFDADQQTTDCLIRKRVLQERSLP